jgi:hypothetical protein
MTLDDLFRRAALRRPSAIALADPPDRASFTGGAPRRLTYAEADRMISAIAGRLRYLGLHSDTIVGIQLPNTVESVLTLLGVLRAGMIAAPLPLLWRQRDLVHALGRLGAKMLITCGRVGAVDHADLAMKTAADVFPIRYVCAFGNNVPDGVVPFDDLYTVEKLDPLPPLERARSDNPAAHLAAITWDATAEGMVPVARNHREIIAGGFAAVLEGRCKPDAVFLSTIPASSFAGLALSVMPWLLTGGTLALHQPFDPDALAAQLKEKHWDNLLLPGPTMPLLAEAGCFAGQSGRTVMALWRAPEQMNGSAAWREKTSTVIDVAAFGEIGLIAARRGASGRPAPLSFGVGRAPRGAGGALFVGEMTLTQTGTLALRGPMVPRHAYPPGAARGGLPYFKSVNGVVDTGYRCELDPASRAMVVAAPPAGMIGVGGYRSALRAFQELIAGIDGAPGHRAMPPISALTLTGH